MILIFFFGWGLRKFITLENFPKFFLLFLSPPLKLDKNKREVADSDGKAKSNPTLVKVDLMLCGVEVSEESSLIPHEEPNDVCHARTFVIPHEGKNGDPPWSRGQ